MLYKKHLFSVAWLLLLIPISVGIVAYRIIKPPSPSSFARTTTGNSTASTPVTEKTPAIDTATLEKYLTVEAALLGVSDSVSIYFKDEPTDKDVSINSVRAWIPASTIKSFAAIEAFRQRDAGLISFDTMVTIQKQNVVPTELEADEFPRLREGTQATVRQLVEAMIIQSDNTAYNTLLDILDRRNINSTLKNYGITQTTVGEKLNLDDDQFKADLQVPGRQPNTITAKDLSTLFDLLYNNKIPHSDEIVSVFKQQKINTMIPALLPPGTVVAHKTGDWEPIYHDGGIVYKPNDPFILSVFTNSNDPSVVAQLARVAYYRTSKEVGENVKPPPEQKLGEDSSVGHIYFAEAGQLINVLGVQTDATTGERIYTVASGDTLWSIAASQYGSGDDYINIITRNAITDPSSISAGTTLYLPPIPGSSFVPEQQNPKLNAADLGVTGSDLKVGKAQVNTIANALILPGAPLYIIKQWLQNHSVATAASTDAKIEALLAISDAKLGEVKSELAFGNVAAVKPLLTQSEDALRQAANLAKSSTNNDVALYKIKQQRDVHYGVLQDAGGSVSASQKDAYIDAVYSFYQKQKQDVQPAIVNAPSTNPLQQQPIVGTVSEIKNNIATVRGDDGKTTQVILTNLTPSRSINQTTTTETATAVRPGEKIAVVGTVTPQSVVTPQFILRDVPKELPVGHRGTVLQINPKEHTIKLQDTQGKIDTIVVNDNTHIKSKDTNVSMGGITAGSTITVVGNIVPPTASPAVTNTVTGAPTTAPNPTNGESESSPTSAENQQSQSVILLDVTPPAIAKPGATIPTTAPSGLKVTLISGAPSPAKGGATTAPVLPTTGQTVNATTVTVDRNASGKNEKVSSSKPSSGGSKPSGPQKSGDNNKATNQSQPPAPPPKQPETKPIEKKK